jgi:hypothetical protein
MTFREGSDEDRVARLLAEIRDLQRQQHDA